MKTLMHTSLGVLLFVGAAAAPASFGQTIEATETTVTSQGTVSEFGPQGIAITTETGRTPIRYLSKDTTNYVDESGLPVDPRSVIPGNPVTVYYTKVGDTLVASKIMVKSLKAGSPASAVQTTRTTTAAAPVAAVETSRTVVTPAPATAEIVESTRTEGIIEDVGNGEMMVQTSSSRTPSRFFFTPTTTYLDEAGVEVTPDAVKSRLPVTVYYTDIGGVHRVSKVVVKPLHVMASPPVVKTTVTEAAPVRESTTVVASEPPSKVMVQKEEVESRPKVTKKRVVEDEAPAPRKNRVEAAPEPEQPRRKVVSTESTREKKPAAPPSGVIQYKKTTTVTTTTDAPKD